MIGNTQLKVTCILMLVFGSAVSAGAAEAVSTLRVATIMYFTPETAAAAGISGLEVQAVLERLADAEPERVVLANAQAFMQDQLVAFVTALHAERHGTGTAGDTEAARQNFDAAKDVVENAIAALREAGYLGLSIQQTSRLAAQVANAATRLVPEFQVVNWTPESVKELEMALIAERRAAVSNTTVPTQAATLLATTRARTDVVEAVTWRTTRLASIRSVFAAFAAE